MRDKVIELLSEEVDKIYDDIFSSEDKKDLQFILRTYDDINVKFSYNDEIETITVTNCKDEIIFSMTRIEGVIKRIIFDDLFNIDFNDSNYKRFNNIITEVLDIQLNYPKEINPYEEMKIECSRINEYGKLYTVSYIRTVDSIDFLDKTFKDFIKYLYKDYIRMFGFNFDKLETLYGNKLMFSMNKIDTLN